MFYFKSAPPPLTADAAQSSQVLEFRQRIGGKGALYWMYEDDQSFTSLLRLHLSLQMQDFYEARSNSVHDSRTLQGRSGRKFSLLKLAPPQVVEVVRLLIQLRALNVQWSRFGALFTRNGASVRRIDMKARDADVRMNSVARVTASELLQLMADTRPLLLALEQSFQIYMDSVAKMAPLFVGWSGHSLIRKLILGRLRHLHVAIDSAMPAYVDLQAALTLFGSLHPAFEEASAVGSAFFDDVAATWMRVLHLVTEAERTYSNF
jgi:hypothetical protein